MWNKHLIFGPPGAVVRRRTSMTHAPVTRPVEVSAPALGLVVNRLPVLAGPFPFTLSAALVLAVALAVVVTQAGVGPVLKTDPSFQAAFPDKPVPDRPPENGTSRRDAIDERTRHGAGPASGKTSALPPLWATRNYRFVVSANLFRISVTAVTVDAVVTLRSDRGSVPCQPNATSRVCSGCHVD